MLFRLGHWCARRRLTVLLVWLVVLIGAGVLVPAFFNRLTGSSLTVYGSSSQRADQLIEQQFDQPIAEDVVVVVHVPGRTVDEPAVRSVISDTASALARDPLVVRVTDPLQQGGESQVSADRSTALLIVGLRGDERARQGAIGDLNEVVESAARDDVQLYLTGSSPINAAVIEQEGKDLSRAEAIGLPVALIVLILAFGTLVAAGLPLVLGIAAIVTAFGLLGAASYVTSFDVFVQAAVTMIGLAIGIDYALFIVNRYREERATRPDADNPTIVGATMATSGKAVLFSGITVLISVAGLMLVRAPAFIALAAGVMVTIATMLAATLTLLPAVLGVLGARINKLAVPGLRKVVDRPDVEGSLWARWTRLVMRRPVIIGGLAGIVLAIMAVPVFDLRLGFDVGTTSISDTPAGRGVAIVTDEFGAGGTTPVRIVARSDDGPLDDRDLAALARLSSDLRNRADIAAVVALPDVLQQRMGRSDTSALRSLTQSQPADRFGELLNTAQDTTVLTVFPKPEPDSFEAMALVRWIRGDAVDTAAAGSTDLEIAVGGLTAQAVDIGDEASRATPLVFLAVLGSSFLLLLLAFRSLLMPLKAILMNLLAVGASFGLLTYVFQEGAGAELFGFTSRGFIQVYLPLLTFVVLFGLSMDYEVFLLSRIKEHWDLTGDNQQSVVVGIASTARVITSAAAIMVVVFASFMMTRVVEVKQMGFALAAAVLVDATLIRLVLVPALMRLFGAANWWLPRWLDKLLPAVHFGESSGQPTAAPERVSARR